MTKHDNVGEMLEWPSLEGLVLPAFLSQDSLCSSIEKRLLTRPSHNLLNIVDTRHRVMP